MRAISSTIRHRVGQMTGASAMLRASRKFIADSSGTSNIEFAFIAPFFIVLMLGMFSVGDMIKVNTKVSKVSSTVSDLAGQSNVLSQQTLDTYMQVTQAVGGEYSDNIEVYVAGIAIDTATGDNEVIWSHGSNNLSALRLPSTGEPYPNLPQAFSNSVSFVVVGRAHLRHTPLFLGVLGDDAGGGPFWGAGGLEALYNYGHTHYFVPRNNPTITCSDC